MVAYELDDCHWRLHDWPSTLNLVRLLKWLKISSYKEHLRKKIRDHNVWGSKWSKGWPSSKKVKQQSSNWVSPRQNSYDIHCCAIQPDTFWNHALCLTEVVVWLHCVRGWVALAGRYIANAELSDVSGQYVPQKLLQNINHSCLLTFEILSLPIPDYIGIEVEK